jgi:hypothetical protein
VAMTATRDSLFAQLLGFDQGRTSVHTVATATTGENGPPINLLVLDRTGCQTIHVQGNGGIIVDAVVAEDDSGTPIGLVEGIAASDSDGSAGCTSDGVIDVDGSGSLLRADGPEGCASESGTHNDGGYTAGWSRPTPQGLPGVAPPEPIPPLAHPELADPTDLSLSRPPSARVSPESGSTTASTAGPTTPRPLQGSAGPQPRSPATSRSTDVPAEILTTSMT